MHFLEDVLTFTEKDKLINFCHRYYQSYLHVINARQELQISSLKIPKKIAITNYTNILLILQKIYSAVKKTFPEASLTSLTLEANNGIAWNNRAVNTFNKATNEICAFYCSSYTDDTNTIDNMSFVHNDTVFGLNNVVVVQGKEELFFNSSRTGQIFLIYLLRLNFNEPVLPWNNEELVYLTDIASRDQSNSSNIIKQNIMDYSDIENV